MRARSKIASVLSVIVVVGLASVRPAAADPLAIVAFGDSWTYGRFLDNSQDAYPAQLQAALKAQGFDVAIQNAGVNGDTSTQGLRRVDTAVPAGTKIALVEFGLNDTRGLRMQGSVGADTTQSNLDEIVRGLQARGVLVLLIGARDLDYASVAAADGAAYEQWPALGAGQFASDGHHPNAVGYKMFVAHMLPAVEQLIARATGGAHS